MENTSQSQNERSNSNAESTHQEEGLLSQSAFDPSGSGNSLPPPPWSGGDDPSAEDSGSSEGSNLSSQRNSTLQLTADGTGAGASQTTGPQAESTSTDQESAPVVAPDEVIALDGGALAMSEAMSEYIESTGTGGADVRVQLGSVLRGSIKLRKAGEGYQTVDAQTSAVPINNRLAHLASGLGAELVAVLEINGMGVSGYTTVRVGGTVLSAGELSNWVTTNAPSFGWTGFDNIQAPGNITNQISGGNLQLSLDNMPVRIGGWVDATLSVGIVNDQFTFEANGTIEVPNLANTELNLTMDEAGQVSGSANAAVTMGNFSGTVAVSYQNGAIDARGTAQYSSEKLSGAVNLLVTDENTARTVAINQMDPAQVNQEAVEQGQIGSQEGAALGPRALAGWGELDFAFTDWMAGKAKVIVDNEGHITVQGEIAPPAEVSLFDQKDYKKALPSLEARAMYGIPLVGNVFIFANIGLELIAKLGPAKLYDIAVSGTYSTDPAILSDINLAASLNMSAYAGVKLRAEGGVGIELADHDIKAGIGLDATAGVKGYVDARPNIGFRETSGDGGGDFYIKGHAEIAAQPFLGLGGDFFVELDSPWWSPAPDKTWDWPIGDLEYPLPGSFGIGADMDYTLGSNELPEIQWGDVDFSAEKFMTDLVNDHVPSDGEREVEAQGTFADGVTTGEGPGGQIVDNGGGSANQVTGSEGPAPGLEEEMRQAQERRRQEEEGGETEGEGGSSERDGETSNETDKEKPSIPKRMQDLITIDFNINPDHDADEFKRQLKMQQNGLKKMTIKKFTDNRDSFKNDRPAVNKKSDKARRNTRRDNRIKDNAIERRASEIFLKEYEAEKEEHGTSPEEFEAVARERAIAESKGWHALHTVDSVAGGDPTGVDDFGDGRVNSSIGSQWVHRVGKIEKGIQTYKDKLKAMDNGETIEDKDLDGILLNVKLNAIQ